jgi:hypothetical protein
MSTPVLTLGQLVVPFDSDQNYRDRLSGVVLASLADRRAENAQLRLEITALLESEAYAQKPKSSEPADTILPPIESLSIRLKAHPDLQSRLALLTQYTTSKWLLEWELKSRGLLNREDNSTDAYERAKQVRAVGVCLSGGGIRSATFNLGMLQGLARLGKLGEIDYLSTVSGGGYIHEFLASWIFREGVETVQRKLDSIPATGSGRVVPPEPIRWLRRYSNYLSPSVSMFGADIWTIAAVWTRNTMLNLVILISAITTLLLLPNFTITELALSSHSLGSLRARLGMFVLIVICAVFAAALLGYSFPRFCAKPEADGTQPSRVCRKDTTRNWHAYAIVLSWLIVSACVAPVVYRLSLPGGSQFSPEANKVYTKLPSSPVVSGQVVMQISDHASSAQWTLCKDNKDACNSESTSSHGRLEAAWKTYKPRCTVPRFLSFLKIPCEFTRNAYQEHGLVPVGISSAADESPLLWLFDIFPLLCIVFCAAIWFAHKETARGWNKFFSVLYPLMGGLFSIALLYGIECLFFVTTFAVHQKLITALGITLLPSLLLAVPFISLELCTGLMGTLFGSAQREWIARLRVVSFLVGLLWLSLAGLSLIGPYIFELVANQVVLKYAIWTTWAISTVSGVLLGKSRLTNGRPSEAADSAGGGWSTKELVIRIAPPVFVVGLFTLLATFASWLLQGPNKNYNVESTLHWAILTGIVALMAFLFGWRIDINEFSMNAFYRDRLARCYAGASNPNRQPNRFTGFDVRDGSLRVAQLLPKKWGDLEEAKSGAYQGPFPIFCTALNLTTGRDLAYQERKAASFAITPLFSGYSTGWTDGTDCSMQYNGFVPTIRHVKAPKGMTVASAVAISGAAASPNMGFHSSTAMAFLMTIFNVRLGWWIRNPRRQAPDAPNVGLWQLIKELTGSTNDTSPFVYLSDGGHFENMGLYELLRRRCRSIIVCDAEADGSLRFEGIGMAIRKARVDFGIEVEVTRALGQQGPKLNANKGDAVAIDVVRQTIAVRQAEQSANTSSPDKEHPSGAEGLLEFKHFPGNLFHAIEGEIRYPEDGPNDKPAQLLYIKSTLTGDEPADIINYHRTHASFPFDTTLNQFFTESQFESYRRLGEHIVQKPEVETWIKRNVPSVPDESVSAD